MLGPQPTISIGRLPVLKGNGVDHAITIEPVMTAPRLVNLVGTVAHVNPNKIARNLTTNGQLAEGSLGCNRCINPFEIRVRNATKPTRPIC